MVIIIELFEPIFLVVGLFTRIAAFSIGANFIGVILTDAINKGFLMNWERIEDKGLEYFVLLLDLILVSLIVDGGRARMWHR